MFSITLHSANSFSRIRVTGPWLVMFTRRKKTKDGFLGFVKLSSIYFTNFMLLYVTAWFEC